MDEKLLMQLKGYQDKNTNIRNINIGLLKSVPNEKQTYIVPIFEKDLSTDTVPVFEADTLHWFLYKWKIGAKPSLLWSKSFPVKFNSIIDYSFSKAFDTLAIVGTRLDTMDNKGLLNLYHFRFISQGKGKFKIDSSAAIGKYNNVFYNHFDAIGAIGLIDTTGKAVLVDKFNYTRMVFDPKTKIIYPIYKFGKVTLFVSRDTSNKYSLYTIQRDVTGNFDILLVPGFDNPDTLVFNKNGTVFSKKGDTYTLNRLNEQGVCIESKTGNSMFNFERGSRIAVYRDQIDSVWKILDDSLKAYTLILDSSINSSKLNIKKIISLSYSEDMFWVTTTDSLELIIKKDSGNNYTIKDFTKEFNEKGDSLSRVILSVKKDAFFISLKKNNEREIIFKVLDTKIGKVKKLDSFPSKNPFRFFDVKRIGTDRFLYITKINTDDDSLQIITFKISQNKVNEIDTLPPCANYFISANRFLILQFKDSALAYDSRKKKSIKNLGIPNGSFKIIQNFIETNDKSVFYFKAVEKRKDIPMLYEYKVTSGKPAPEKTKSSSKQATTHGK